MRLVINKPMLTHAAEMTLITAAAQRRSRNNVVHATAIFNIAKSREFWQKVIYFLVSNLPNFIANF